MATEKSGAEIIEEAKAETMKNILSGDLMGGVLFDIQQERMRQDELRRQRRGVIESRTVAIVQAIIEAMVTDREGLIAIATICVESCEKIDKANYGV